MFCIKCGTKINDGDIFCTNCGAKIVIENKNKQLSFADQIKGTIPLSSLPSETDVYKMNTILFGSYPQSDKSGKTKDPIEWILLFDHALDRKALLLSKNIIDYMEFQPDNECSNIWKDSLLRKQLNSEFYSKAFDDNEKSLIIENDDISDKVFCLSVEEVKKFFKHSVDVTGFEIFGKNVEALSTTYSHAKYMQRANFWLRTPDEEDNNKVYYMWLSGDYNKHNSFATGPVGWTMGVRPAIWVKY